MADAEQADDVTFHARQAVEKSLKAVIVTLSVEVPYTHDVSFLLDTLASEKCLCRAGRPIGRAHAMGGGDAVWRRLLAGATFGMSLRGDREGCLGGVGRWSGWLTSTARVRRGQRPLST